MNARISKEALFRELSGNVYTLRKKAKLGINQGQLFVRIPKKISKLLDLDVGSKVEFVLVKEGSKVKLELVLK